MQKTFRNGLGLCSGECVGELARFFPGAVPIRISVRVTKEGPNTVTAPEHTLIEFGTASEVLFVSTLPLDFDDTVRLRNSDGSLDVEAEIIAMRLHHGQMAVAARFLQDVKNWIIKA
jgi:hypothetical protein